MLNQCLQPGDVVDIIAPASATPRSEQEKTLHAIRELLLAWNLKPNIPENIWGDDLLCANSDKIRYQQLADALSNSKSKAVWCLRGGYGAMRLLPLLNELPQPSQQKIFIGMSDITCLHLFLQQEWQWPSLHCFSATQASLQRVADENIVELKNILFGSQKNCEFSNLIPLNNAALQTKIINTKITGGNLTLVQCSIGTAWQAQTHQKILFLEEVSERGYRVDRTLQQLTQAGVFQNVSAVILGDFTEGNEPDGSNLIVPVLKRFAQENNFPVFNCPGIGHAKFNRPLPLGFSSVLQCGNKPSLHITL